MATNNKYDDGFAPSKLLQIVSLILLAIGCVLMLIPPTGFWAVVSMTLVLLGLGRIARKRDFPNTWWFWFFSAISFVLSSGMVFPITKFELPTSTLPTASYYLGCVGAIISGTFGIVMFVKYAWIDIRARRFRFEDD